MKWCIISNMLTQVLLLAIGIFLVVYSISILFNRESVEVLLGSKVSLYLVGIFELFMAAILFALVMLDNTGGLKTIALIAGILFLFESCLFLFTKSSYSLKRLVLNNGYILTIAAVIQCIIGLFLIFYIL